MKTRPGDPSPSSKGGRERGKDYNHFCDGEEVADVAGWDG
jgi:hypothetical protein